VLPKRRILRRTTSGTTWPVALLATLGLAMALAGCATSAQYGFGHLWLSDKECLARVMYFESNRSSDAGMLAVGTVVMNRLGSGAYPHTICGVVGQPGQFASGVFDRPMSGPGRVRAERVADAVLAGERHPGVGRAMYFHTAGVSFPYRNMHYVLVAGGNAFYEKTTGDHVSELMPTAFGPETDQSGDADRLAFFLTTGQGLSHR
jgi:spore germination cell wall hydrolase CwlJ-like protein